MKLTELQQNKINELFNIYKSDSTEAYFSAPTGSGKTFMISNLSSMILKDSLINNKKTIIFISTLSNNNLPLHFYNKLKHKYIKYLDYKNFNIKHLESPSASKAKTKDGEYNINLQENTIYISGTSSFGKNTIFRQNHEINNFLEEIKIQDYNLIYIRDEAHVGAEKLINTSDSKNIDELLKEYASFTLKMTATFKEVYENFVELTEDELMKEQSYLLKETANYNNGLENFEEVHDFEILKESIKKYKEIEKRYNSIKIENINNDKYNINPAMIIQISDKKQKDDLKLFDKNLKQIKKILNDNNLIWYQYFADEIDSSHENNLNQSLYDISENNSPIDVVIIKVGPSIGWDIPRACMLVQLRSVYSESLNKQVVGRIKRNPLPGKYINEYMNYYIYSNYKDKNKRLLKYQLKYEFKDWKFYRSTLTVDNKKSSIKANITKSMTKFLIDNLHEIRKNLSDSISNNKIIISSQDLSIIEKNIDKHKKVKYIETELLDAIDLKIFVNNYLKGKGSFINEFLTAIDNAINEFNFILSGLDFNDSKFSIFIVGLYFIHDKILSKYRSIYNEKVPQKYSIYKDSKLPDKAYVWESSHYWNVQEINEKYAYKNISLKKQDQSKQYLDSDNESKYLKYLQKELLRYSKDIKLITKVPVIGHEIYIEYLNYNRDKINKSLVDAIIKYKDYQIYLEVKSKENDYNDEKTESIISGYNNLSTHIIENNKNNKSKLILGLVKYNPSTGLSEYHFTSPYKFINNKLKYIDGFTNNINEIFNFINLEELDNIKKNITKLKKENKTKILNLNKEFIKIETLIEVVEKDNNFNEKILNEIVNKYKKISEKLETENNIPSKD